LGTTAPEHQGKRGSRADQKTRRVNKIDNPALSAKPPSPVQIRTAPPNSFGKPHCLRLGDTSGIPECRPSESSGGSVNIWSHVFVRAAIRRVGGLQTSILRCALHRNAPRSGGAPRHVPPRRRSHTHTPSGSSEWKCGVGWRAEPKQSACRVDLGVADLPELVESGRSPRHLLAERIVKVGRKPPSPNSLARWSARDMNTGVNSVITTAGENGMSSHAATHFAEVCRSACV
jgi:hypothetical protein